ncbi:MAG: 50S ribosomal protein L23 [Candidatus Doudnabacteria bacterium]|nr:50S ribosomal protein L23 [Candidatus Doudnabacteria bacterium]
MFSKKTEKKDNKTALVSAVSDQTLSPASVFSIIKPRVSEKSSKLAQAGKYVFLVKQSANKIEVKKAVEKNYKVHVTQVNIINNKAKAINFGRTTGKRSPFKKAVVTLKKGESIDAPENK